MPCLLQNSSTRDDDHGSCGVLAGVKKAKIPLFNNWDVAMRAHWGGYRKVALALLVF